jgi:hypothetical protein
MQRWRNLQSTSEGEDGFLWPHSGEDGSSLVVPRDKGKDRARCNSAEGFSSSPSLSNVKLPRPRSWMSNLLGVAAAPLARQRHHSYDDQPSQGSHLMPVSTLVLRDEPNIAKRDAPLPPLPLGNLQAASRSTPDLSSLPIESLPIESDSFSRRKPVPLVVRNLDTSPRGAFTPTIPPFAQQSSPTRREWTTPWSTFEQDLSSRKELIDPEEEEAMIHNAVAEKRRQGAMAGEERAVLDMLDQMNNSVDTFERPAVSRAQSRATASQPRHQSRQEGHRSRQESSIDASRLQPPASISPTRLSVKAFASALDEYDSSSRSSSPVRGGSSSPIRPAGNSTKQVSSDGSSSIGRQGGVKRVIEEREKLDLGSKDLLSPSADPPARLAYLRQDSASTVSSYASQTNAFLNRRATHAADRRITHSPSLSYVSSGHGSSTTFWSKKGYTTESPITSPEPPSGSEDKNLFRFDSTRARDTNERPFFRRMRTDETDNTSLESFGDTPSSSKQTSTTTHEDTTLQVQNIRAIDFATLRTSESETRPVLFRPAPLRGSSASTALQQTTSSSPLKTPKRASANRDVTYAEGGVTPGKLGSPKKGAKDLIRFFEQTSAPNSPQQSPAHSRTNTPAALRQFNQALGSSVNDNKLASPSPFAAASGAVQQQASPGKAGRSRPWKGAAAEAEEVQSSDDGADVFGNQENLPSFAMRSDRQRQSSRPVSVSFLGRMRSKVPGGESAEAAESPRRSSSGQLKSGIDRLMTALSPSTKMDSNEAGGRQMATDADAVEEGKGDRQSIVSSESKGTARSLRQTNEVDDDADLNPPLTIMGQPGATAYRTGLVYYFNVHAEPPVWQWAQAVLLPSAVALSWIPAGGGRVSLVLDLVACREVHSVHGPSHPSSHDDIGARVAREQNLNQICPWQLVFDDGVERMAVDSASDRVQWVNAVW